jgi:hypothetical protein
MTSKLELEEEHLDAHDAYSSAITLCLLVVIAIGIGSLRTKAAMQAAGAVGGVVTIVRALEILSAVVGLALLLATRHRPRPGLAFAISAVLLLPQFPMLLVVADAAYRVGRPVEAFVLPHIASLGVALIVPGRFAVGLGILLLLQVETLEVWFTRMREPEIVPYAEPFVSLMFGVLGALLVWMRAQRRSVMRHYLRAGAEAEMFRALGATLDTLREQLVRALEVISSGLDRLGSPPAQERSESRLQTAVARLGVLGARLSRPESSQARETAPVPAAATEPRSAPATAAERALFARDAHNAAIVWSVITLVECLLAIAGSRTEDFGWQRRWFWPAQCVSGLLWLGVLLYRRRRPSQTLALVSFVSILAPYFVSWWMENAHFLPGQPLPFELFIGPKLGMAVMAMVVPRYLGLGVALDCLVIGGCLFVYQHFHLAELGARTSLTEPYATVLVFGLGLAFLFLREQRRVASLEALRKDTELAALARQAGMSMAILDQMGSPLQVLTIEIARMQARSQPGPELTRIQEALSKLVALRRTIPHDVIARGLARESFDSAHELTRREIAPLPSV